ncbi:MAG: hypothetical protein ACI8QS_002618 [Planctomycetota bacterium]|jgi:hypothetical protein
MPRRSQQLSLEEGFLVESGGPYPGVSARRAPVGGGHSTARGFLKGKRGAS